MLHPILPRTLKSTVPITCTSGGNFTGAKQEAALLQQSLSERRRQELCWKRSVLGGLTLLEQRKTASTPLSPISPLPAAAAALGLRQVKGRTGARLRHSQEEVLGQASSYQTRAGRAYPAGVQEGLLE